MKSLPSEIRDNVIKMVERVFVRFDEETTLRAERGDPPLELPLWRILRQEVWRTNGCLLDLERLADGPRKALYDFVVGRVAASLIQQRERLFDLCDSLIGFHIDSHCPPDTHVDDWGLDNLEEALRDQFNLDFDLPKDSLTQQKIAQTVWEVVESRIDERQEELTRPWLMYFARHFYLEEIDNQWIDHLKTMDHLREGIGLRGYGQKDPKKEYKKEGFDLFSEMMSRIQINGCRNIFHVQIQREEEEDLPEFQAKKRRMNAVHPSADQSTNSEDGGGGSSSYGDAADGSKKAPEKQGTVRRTTPKIGRNDPCHCGSGKKYKKCHGRPGAEASV